MSQSNDEVFLTSAIKLFQYYKKLGDGALAQIGDADINVRLNEASNSIALIVHHMSGNMLSRWTDFLTSDGEKTWRNREAEFEETYADKAALLVAWETGWKCLFDAITPLKPSDLATLVYIRNEGQPVMEAIQRQLAHYSMHVGQIIYQAKAIRGQAFTSLSIPKGDSSKYNAGKFEQEKSVRHFTDKV